MSETGFIKRITLNSASAYFCGINDEEVTKKFCEEVIKANITKVKNLEKKWCKPLFNVNSSNEKENFKTSVDSLGSSFVSRKFTISEIDSNKASNEDRKSIDCTNSRGFLLERKQITANNFKSCISHNYKHDPKEHPLSNINKVVGKAAESCARLLFKDLTNQLKTINVEQHFDLEENFINWIQCESCKKWRVVPLAQFFQLQDSSFVCSENTWDRFKSCHIGEQKHFSDIKTTLPISLYEKGRLENVIKNNQFLKVLGFDKALSLIKCPSIEKHVKTVPVKKRMFDKSLFVRRSVRPQTQRKFYSVIDMYSDKELKRVNLRPIIVISPAEGTKLVKGKKTTIEWEGDYILGATDLYLALIKDEPSCDWIYIVAQNVQCSHPSTEGRYELEWEVPMDLVVGENYYLEIASCEKRTVGRSEYLVILNPYGCIIEEDVGVWCKCGAATSDMNYKGMWVICTLCKAWQHGLCYDLTADTKITENFHCCFCQMGLNQVILASRFLEMLTKTTTYRRLLKNSFCSTPDHVGKFLATLIRDSDRCVVDLGAGTGAFTRYITQHVCCIEDNTERFNVGKKAQENRTWVQADILSKHFLNEIVQKPSERYDVVCSNPDFEVALQFIYVGLFLLQCGNENARLIFLLPSDYFEGSSARIRAYKLLDMHIEKEYRIGRLGYFQHNRDLHKATSDSIFVLKPGRTGKFAYHVVNARLAGML